MINSETMLKKGKYDQFIIKLEIRQSLATRMGQISHVKLYRNKKPWMAKCKYSETRDVHRPPLCNRLLVL